MYVCLGCGRLLGQGDISRSPYGARGQHMHEDVFGLKKCKSFRIKEEECARCCQALLGCASEFLQPCRS